jgi:hypothetical protein
MSKKLITEDSPAEQGQRAAKLDDAIRDAIKRGDKELARKLIDQGFENGRNIKFSDFVKESTDPLIGAVSAALARKPEGMFVTEMAFTRQHYVAIARIIKDTKNDYSGEASARGAIAALKQVANDLASFFKQDNSSFDKERFLNACGF